MDLNELVDILQNDPDPMNRAQAANELGNAADWMTDDDKRTLAGILNEAMLDSDPMVLTAAMTALGKIRVADTTIEDDFDETEPIATVNACSVCGKPEVLVAPETCEYDNCPYK